MRLFVLDTDILTLFERGHATVSARVAEHPPAEIAISIVTVEEQLSGWYAQLRKAKSPERLACELGMELALFGRLLVGIQQPVLR
jgi:tRNA(fMet)-specific endonuclease VapC